MKRYIIRKGCHYSNFIPSFKCLKGLDKVTYERTFEFTESCRYGIEEESCVNKLFGLCFGFGVHQDSVRFGWTYIDPIDTVFIYAYRYVKGKLLKTKIYEIEVGEQRTFKIEIFKDNGMWNYQMFIDERMYNQGTFITNKKFITTLGPYFGGKTRAPHKIVIKQI